MQSTHFEDYELRTFLQSFLLNDPSCQPLCCHAGGILAGSASGLLIKVLSSLCKVSS